MTNDRASGYEPYDQSRPSSALDPLDTSGPLPLPAEYDPQPGTSAGPAHDGAAQPPYPAPPGSPAAAPAGYGGSPQSSPTAPSYDGGTGPAGSVQPAPGAVPPGGPPVRYDPAAYATHGGGMPQNSAPYEGDPAGYGDPRGATGQGPAAPYAQGGGAAPADGAPYDAGSGEPAAYGPADSYSPVSARSPADPLARPWWSTSPDPSEEQAPQSPGWGASQDGVGDPSSDDGRYRPLFQPQDEDPGAGAPSTGTAPPYGAQPGYDRAFTAWRGSEPHQTPLAQDPEPPYPGGGAYPGGAESLQDGAPPYADPAGRPYQSGGQAVPGRDIARPYESGGRAIPGQDARSPYQSGQAVPGRETGAPYQGGQAGSGGGAGAPYQGGLAGSGGGAGAPYQGGGRVGPGRDAAGPYQGGGPAGQGRDPYQSGAQPTGERAYGPGRRAKPGGADDGAGYQGGGPGAARAEAGYRDAAGPSGRAAAAFQESSDSGRTRGDRGGAARGRQDSGRTYPDLPKGGRDGEAGREQGPGSRWAAAEAAEGGFSEVGGRRRAGGEDTASAAYPSGPYRTSGDTGSFAAVSGSHRRRKRKNGAGKVGLAGAVVGIAGIVAVAVVIVVLRPSSGGGHQSAQTGSSNVDSGIPRVNTPKAGAVLSIATSDPYTYGIAAVGGGVTGQPLLKSGTAAPDGTVYAYIDFVFSNTGQQPALLDMSVADLFVKKTRVVAAAQSRCMPQPGAPDDSCTLPNNTAVIGLINGSRPPTIQSGGDQYMPAGASYLMRVETTFPVVKDTAQADMSLYVWQARYIASREAAKVAFP